MAEEMECYILSKDFQKIALLESYSAFIWTERYAESGDFVVTLPLNAPEIPYLVEDNYLMLTDSQHVMVIETMGIDSDAEAGVSIKYTGRTLDSFLDRRIIWANPFIIDGSVHAGIKSIIKSNIISPGILDRRIPNFVFVDSTDPKVTTPEVEAQFTWDNLYAAIVKLLASCDLGLRVFLVNGVFEFKIYAGVDRSYQQNTNPFVVFSPNFENLKNSSFFASKATKKTVTLVGGEGEGSARRWNLAYASGGALTGLDRRELHTDARDISSTNNGGNLSSKQYMALLRQRGVEDLANNTYTKTFAGEADPRVMYTYGKDFFLGDIVQITNEFDMATPSRIVEYVRSKDVDGYSVYPTFKPLQEV